MSDNPPYGDSADCIVQSDWKRNGDPSEAIVDAIAIATGRDPLDVEPLQNYVDTDALDALVTPQSDDDGHVRVAFSYESLDVVATSKGVVEVRSGAADR